MAAMSKQSKILKNGVHEIRKEVEDESRRTQGSNRENEDANSIKALSQKTGESLESTRNLLQETELLQHALEKVREFNSPNN